MRTRAGVFAAALLAAACGGCSTTISTIEAQSPLVAEERAALSNAALGFGAGAWAPAAWLEVPAAATPVDLLLGGAAINAARAYAVAIEGESVPLAVLNGHATDALAATLRLIEAADDVVAMERADMKDVSLIEGAIQTTRFRKAVFLEAIALVPASDVERQIAAVSIRGRFDAASLALAAVADELAAAAIEARFSEAGIGPVPPRSARVDGAALGGD